MGVIVMNHIGNLQLVRKKLRTATMKNCFIENHCNPDAQLTFTWKGIEFYQKLLTLFLPLELEALKLAKEQIA